MTLRSRALVLLFPLAFAACPGTPDPPALIRLADRLEQATVESAVDLASSEEALRADVEPVFEGPAATRHEGAWIAPLLLDAPTAPRALSLVQVAITPARMHRVVVDAGRDLADDELLFVLELPSPGSEDDTADPAWAEATLRNHRTFLRPLATDGDGRGKVRFGVDDDSRALLVAAVMAPAADSAAPAVKVRVERFSERAGWILALNRAVEGGSPWRRSTTVSRVTYDSIVLGAPGSLTTTLRLPSGAPAFSTRVAVPFADRHPQVTVEVEVTDGDRRVAGRASLDGRAPRWTDLTLDLGPLAGREVVVTLHARPLGGEGQLVAFGAPIIEAADPADTRPDVVVVSLDTARADRLSLYGFERPTSPALQTLAKDAVVFERAYTTAPWTLPSHVSLLSGDLPDRHGVHGSKSRIREETPWLPEALARAGYVTLAFTGGGYVNPAFGFGRGFDRYGIVDPAFPPSGWAEARNDPRDRAGAQKSLASREELLATLSRPRRAPLFAFVHTYVAHDYAASPADLTAVGAAPAALDRLLRDFSPTEASRDAATLSDERKDEIRRRYDATLREADRLVADVLAALERSGRLDDTVVVVMSDHGEELFERGNLGHGQSVHEELVRVPLVVKAPGARPARRDDVVSLVDVAPTIRALVGLEPSAHDGRDLSPVLAGRDLPFHPAFARGTRRDLVFRAVVGPALKLIREDRPGAAPSRELYDLEVDPGERAPATGERGEDADRLERVLTATVERVRREGESAGEAAMSADVVRELKALGYLGEE